MSLNFHHRTNPFCRAALIPCVLQLLILGTNAFAEDAAGGGTLFPKTATVTPLDETIHVPELEFGFKDVITKAIGENAEISKDPDFRFLLVQLHDTFKDLNAKSLRYSNASPELTGTQKNEKLDEMTEQWENAVDDTILNNKLRAKRWMPLVKQVKAHLKAKSALEENPLEPNNFSHRAEVYHELAGGIKAVVKEYDLKKSQEDDAIREGKVPEGNAAMYSESNSRCRKRKRCALELLF